MEEGSSSDDGRPSLEARYGVILAGGSLTRVAWTSSYELAKDVYDREISLGRPAEFWVAERIEK